MRRCNVIALPSVLIWHFTQPICSGGECVWAEGTGDSAVRALQSQSCHWCKPLANTVSTILTTWINWIYFGDTFWEKSTVSVRCELNSKQCCSTWARAACSHAWRDGCCCWAAGQRWTSATDTPSDPQPCSLSLITFPEWGRWIWCVSPQTRAAAQGPTGE